VFSIWDFYEYNGEVRQLANQVYGFFDSSVDDERHYADADMARALRMISGDGVAALGENLRVVSAQDGLHTRVLFGGAVCRGYYYALEDDGGAPLTLAHEAAPSFPRIDRVVLRLNRNTDARHITLALRQGTPAVSPEPPALRRDETIYELSLARVHVATGAGLLHDTDIVDERDDEALCGVLAPARVEQLFAGLTASGMPTSAPGVSVQDALDSKLPCANVVNSLLETQAGYALDARQGPALRGEIDSAAGEALHSRPCVYPVTLAATGWTGGAAPFEQTLSVNGILAQGYLHQPYPAPASFVIYANAGIVMQDVTTDGAVTFHAQKAPAVDLDAIIASWLLGPEV